MFYKLIKKFPSSIGEVEELFESAKYLNKHYITTRYHGFAEGAPEKYYTKKDAKNAINHAEKILKFCENKISNPSKKNNEHNG